MKTLLSGAAPALLIVLLAGSPAIAVEPVPAPVETVQARPVPEQTEPEVRPADGKKPAPAAGAAQPNAAGPGGDDYRVQRALRIARDLLEKEQFTEALPLLQKLLESQQDRMLVVPGNNSQVSRSLKAEIRSILTGMSPAGLRSSELQYGAAARAALRNALRTGETDALTDVARQYPVTVAGRQAASLLADRLLDSGEPLAAARWLERLQSELPPGSSPTSADRLRLAVCWYRAGRPERASQALLAPRNEQQPGEQPQAAAEQTRQLLQWLQSAVQSGANTLMSLDAGWWLHQGSASRNTAHHVPEGTGTVHPRWPVAGVSLLTDATADPDQAEGTAVGQRLRKSGRELLRLYREKHSNTTLPRSSPLVVGHTVFVRSFSTLAAFRLETGELLWESLPEATFEELALSGPEALTGPILEFMVRQRLLGDATWATLSSDGTAIYAVEDSGFSRVIARPGREGPLPVAATNRLVAFDPATGRRLWESGGGDGIRHAEEDSTAEDSSAAGEESSDSQTLPLAGMFFYGPPLPLSGRLYAIGETDGRIELVSVEHRTAGTARRNSAAAAELRPASVPQLEVSWRQMLDEVGSSQDEALRRRLSGGTPSASGGVLVCPTGTGSLVAVDLGLRTLL
ncbi:MAG: PQQ-binding-like beta-propeller repeat protein, partial [Planctomycetaceae bacterium]|nr:PQQ-binding-like beta-propeller repeat protein [Planctomycetaceae bacterium]